MLTEFPNQKKTIFFFTNPCQLMTLKLNIHVKQWFDVTTSRFDEGC